MCRNFGLSKYGDHNINLALKNHGIFNAISRSYPSLSLATINIPKYSD
tara:strand:- start:10506 stop:10649 length:144 start_codon:yes stop_codon:yes gene_type:complete